MLELLENQFLIYFIYFGCVAVASVLVNKLLLRFAQNLGTRNNESQPRWSSTQKPSIGGFSFYFVFLIAIVTVSLLPLDRPDPVSMYLFGLFGASTFGFLIGLADDAYNTKPALKFLGQLTCANILVATGIIIPISPDAMMNYIFTVVWVIGMMNSINMLDNMDGITASVSLTIILSALMFIILNDESYSAFAVLLIGVAAALMGFLYYNWYPSKMFMGDSGSQFLGVFLAGISIIFLWRFKAPTEEYFQVRQFIAPLIVFIIPIIDTTTVFIRRISRGQSPFVGGKDHTTHHLAYLGLRDDLVAAFFVIISGLSIVLSYFIYQLLDNWKEVYNYYFVGYFLTLFIIFQILYELGKKRKRSQEKIAEKIIRQKVNAE